MLKLSFLALALFAIAFPPLDASHMAFAREDGLKTPPQNDSVKAYLYWPGKRPDWCDADVHFCISSEDSANLKSAYIISERYTKPYPVKGSLTPDAKLGERCSHKYFGAHRTGIKEVKAVVVESAVHWKTHKTMLLCQPLPEDGASAWKLQFGPGTHTQTINVFARYPIVITGGTSAVEELAPPTEPRPVDNRPVIECAKGKSVGDHSSAGKGCIRGRENNDVTISGLKLRMAFLKADGTWQARGDHYYRCIMPGTGKLTVTDTDLINCRHGVQSGDGTVWEFLRVRMENCSFQGNGKVHCIYSAPPTYKGDPVHGEIIVKDSYLQTCGGHVIKTNSDKTVVKNSVLVEGQGKKCDTGNAIHNNAAMSVFLENVIVKQLESAGNRQIFSVGSGRLERCRGKRNGEWTVKNVTIIDTEPKGKRSHRYQEHCPLGPGKWTDLGGNKINGEPLFNSRGVPYWGR